MAISDEDIQRVKTSTDSFRLFSEHGELRRVGQRRHHGRCPFHEDRVAAFHVNIEEGLYFCFACNAKGDVFGFVRQRDGVDFDAAVRLLARRANIEIQAPTDKPDGAEQGHA